MSVEDLSPTIPFPPLVIALAGASGSGKTTLAAELAHALDGFLFPLDNYYRDLSHLPMAERAQTNFDDPAMIESPLLVEHVAALARGESIRRPQYDFSTHSRLTGQEETVRPGAYLLVEGLFALCFAGLLPHYAFRVYIDTPDPLCFERRMKRDVEQRGRTVESVERQYTTTVRPASVHYVRPSSVHADLVLDGTDALDWKVERVLSEMRQRGLLNLPGGRPA